MLLVEPDDSSRSVMEAVLLREGFEIAAATSAEGARLQLAPGKPLPSVLVCEATLQGADGFSFCKQIRDEPRTAMLPFILLSRRLQKHDPSLAASVGADDFIAKPAFANDVVALVQLRAGANSFDASFRSSTAVVPLPRLLRALLAGIRSGRVELENGGEITFREGLVIDAVLEKLRSVDALTRMLLLAEGDYTVTFSSEPVNASFSLGLEELCTTIFQRIHRWQEEAAAGPPLDLKLVVNFARLGAVLPELPVGVKELIRLCDGLRTVRHCLLESSLSESLALAAMVRLQGLGVLTPAASTTAPNVFSLRPLGGPLPSVRAVDQPIQETVSTTEAREPVSGESTLSIPEVGSPSTASAAVEPSSATSVSAPAAMTDAERAFLLDYGDPVPRGPAEARTPKTGARRALRLLGGSLGVVMVAAGAAWVTWKAATDRVPAGTAVAARQQATQSGDALGEKAATTVPALNVSARSEDELGSNAEAKAAEGARTLARMAQSHPSATTWLVLGRARFDSGDYRGAEQAAARALEINPSSGPAMMLRASVFLATHRLEEAAGELQRYLETEPAGPYAEEAKQLLSSW